MIESFIQTTRIVWRNLKKNQRREIVTDATVLHEVSDYDSNGASEIINCSYGNV